ncbi:MAG: phosphate ABC transporter permease PstA [Candidatus Omnitrophica bacterium]|nr:phosphate ABC transporter permease PstA [Candidatus Omnitrophota bacterium]
MKRSKIKNTLDTVPIWVTGSMLGVALLMIVALLGLILVQGLGAFWPQPLWKISLNNGQEYLALDHRGEVIPAQEDSAGEPLRRTLYRIGNKDLYGKDFVWIDHSEIKSLERPREAVAVERLEWGPLYGYVQAVIARGVQSSGRSDEVWNKLQEQLPLAAKRRKKIHELEKAEIGRISGKISQARLDIKKVELKMDPGSLRAREMIDAQQKRIKDLNEKYEEAAKTLAELRAEDREFEVLFRTVEGHEKSLPISSIVRLYEPNRLTWFGKAGVYLSRMAEFILGQPREANSEGGVAPAIFGTVMMTLIMTIAVVPLGVLAAFYLHEYAKQGPMVSGVRIAVNNLAGVPSIVFGVFGVGFFCYMVGGTIDQLFYPERLPSPTFGGGGILWASLTLALLTLPVVIVSTEEALAAVPNSVREASLACGATKFQTVWKVVMKAATPGILTGAILAMARGAGEVAPLMITGVVKLAPDLPVDAVWPYLHFDRKFMHLGFHIYDVGFQSPNIEASKAMVYMTSLLLLTIVVCLNISAMQIRARLRGELRDAAT